MHVEIQPSVSVLKLPSFICDQNQKVIFSAMEKPVFSKLKIENAFFYKSFHFY